ncbi:tRNA dihydrouridine synthase DusB [Candidatus Micrarchaeota archaeon CG_4_10_14_0_2_um_filter_55_9]|nr:MAG: hypothetical protein AUJ15_00470 [Candidatus Micrarchaeota archaeon CG1_02_55_41]PIZ91459.1 MAG: tRNA dihydrouridine synthase DusB [Candidatus Micrarchaeota archaeon CG_4_10_14_0_2_um_filter_55_9]
MHHTRVGLAPMAGYTDLAYRMLCRKCGADLACTEMVSAEALCRGNEKTSALLKTNRGDKPLAIQLFGANERSLCEAAGLVEKKADWVDLNAGCPSQDLTRNGCGAALLKDKKKAASLVEALASTTKKPVSVKMRLGWARNECVELCKAFDKAGAQRVAIHGRTAKQDYSDKADWEAIAKAKAAVSCEVFGNGDLKNRSDAEAHALKYGLDGALIGRAALGNPAVFGKRMDKRKAFLEWLAAAKPDFARAKLQAMAFSTGLPAAKTIRIGVSKAESVAGLKRLFC